MHPLVSVVKILKKISGDWENLGESGGQSFKGSVRESVNFIVLATSDIQFSLFFGEVDQQTKLVPLVKKSHYHRRTTQKNNTFS